ncbi:MAG: IS1595 family transposase [Candidatus Lokiarchaeota archaeon]|nr:IS1595 family transposase [Candidatus Lokiarchaeota archaeon]
MKNTTIQQFFKKFPSDEACLEHIMKTRYGLESKCPKCEKKTKFHRVKSQRAYVCQWCGWHTYPCVDTPFESSRTSLQLWFYAIYLFSTTRSGVSAKELQRQLGVTYKCAWRMGHEIRKYMAEVDGDNKLDDIVEVDETYIGGKKEGKRGRGADGKSIVFGMMEKDGDIMTKIVDDVKAKTLQPIIESNVEKGSEIQSDELRSYKSLNKKGFKHKTVNHGQKEYVAKDGTTVNSLEGFWSRLKLSIKGTHIHVSKKHLAKYASEFEYRFNSRSCPEAMFEELLNSFEKPSLK